MPFPSDTTPDTEVEALIQRRADRTLVAMESLSGKTVECCQSS